MRVLLSIVVLNLFVLLNSCQKEVMGKLEDDPVVNVADSTLVWKYVEVDTTLPSGSDTTEWFYFNYDSLKRISRIYNIEGTNIPLTITTDFFYNGSDTLPFKTVEISREGADAYVDTCFYTYNSNGLVIKDSSVYYDFVTFEPLYRTINKFTITGDNVAVYHREDEYDGTLFNILTEQTGNASIVRQNGNISEQVSTGTVINDLYYKINYNNKINPLYRADLHYPVMGGFGNTFDTKKNLQTSLIVGSSPSLIFGRYEYTYTFRADGYPLTVEIKDIDNLQEYYGKTILFYTK